MAPGRGPNPSVSTWRARGSIPGAAGAQPREGITPFAGPASAGAARPRGGIDSHGDAGARRWTGAAAPAWRSYRVRGIAAALGHSLASAEATAAAVERGARHVTHLFNAMGALHHRAPGLAGAALSDDRLSCDLICDGVHVHPGMVAVAARAKGAGLVLISDRVDPPETPGGSRSFGSGPCPRRRRRRGGSRTAASRAAASRSMWLCGICSSSPGFRRSMRLPPAACARRGCWESSANAEACGRARARTSPFSTTRCACARPGSRVGASTPPDLAVAGDVVKCSVLCGAPSYGSLREHQPRDRRDCRELNI